jgi:hypothetical protein
MGSQGDTRSFPTTWRGMLMTLGFPHWWRLLIIKLGLEPVILRAARPALAARRLRSFLLLAFWPHVLCRADLQDKAYMPEAPVPGDICQRRIWNYFRWGPCSNTYRL